ncbi:MAG TPA: hypothetical protein VGD17_04470 [Chitinophagaceae bacterium]
MIKKMMSVERIEKVRRFKNLQRSSFRALTNSELVPEVRIQIGSASFEISYISQIPLQEWRQIVAAFDNLSSDAQKELALVNLLKGISIEPQFLNIISQPYLKSIITNREMYNCLLGGALYMNGKLKEAFGVFSQNATDFPSVFNYILASRAAIMMNEDETEARDILNAGLSKFPNDPVLKLSLAGSYNRSFQTDAANEVLLTLDEAFLNKIKAADVAATSASNLVVFEKELETAISQKLTERPKVDYGKVGDTYNESSVIGYWNQLFYAFNYFNRYQHGWSNLAFMIQSIMQEVIDRDSSVDQVIDFGTFCADPLFRLSKLNQDLRFVGVDREISTKKLNDLAFNNSNLEFVAGYITDELPKLKSNRKSLLFHSRTATLIYPQQVKNIYKACAENGVKYIALYENFGLSRTKLRYFDFENLPALAIPYASVMIIHNYPQYLDEAGYEVIVEKRLPYADLLWHGNETALGDAHGYIIARLK